MKRVIYNTDYDTCGISLMFWKIDYFKNKKYILRVQFMFWNLSILI